MQVIAAVTLEKVPVFKKVRFFAKPIKRQKRTQGLPGGHCVQSPDADAAAKYPGWQALQTVEDALEK